MCLAAGSDTERSIQGCVPPSMWGLQQLWFCEVQCKNPDWFCRSFEAVQTESSSAWTKSSVCLKLLMVPWFILLVGIKHDDNLFSKQPTNRQQHQFHFAVLIWQLSLDNYVVNPKPQLISGGAVWWSLDTNWTSLSRVSGRAIRPDLFRPNKYIQSTIVSSRVLRGDPNPYIILKAYIRIQYLEKPSFISALSVWPLAAFGREHLLGERWLLGSSANGAEGIWADIARMNNDKQELFIKRILFQHRLAIQRSTSNSQQVRLAPAQWDKEIEIACLGAYIITTMKSHRDPEKNNAQVFSGEVMKQCTTRFIEGYLVHNWDFLNLTCIMCLSWYPPQKSC